MYQVQSFALNDRLIFVASLIIMMTFFLYTKSIPYAHSCKNYCKTLDLGTYRLKRNGFCQLCVWFLSDIFLELLTFPATRDSFDLSLVVSVRKLAVVLRQACFLVSSGAKYTREGIYNSVYVRVACMYASNACARNFTISK